VTNIKMFGIGLGLAMLTDASIVRSLLVPALMRLAGQANWWAPRPLRWIYDRFGLRESDSVMPGAPESPASRPLTPATGRER
jgi:RND superfamily putative drug exporter